MKAAAWCIRAWRETPRARVGLRSRVRTFWTNHSVSNNPAAIFPHASCSDRAVTLRTTPVAVRRTVQVTVEKDKGISGIGNAIWNNIDNSRIGSLVRRDTISQSSVISLIARSRHHRERDHRPELGRRLRAGALSVRRRRRAGRHLQPFDTKVNSGSNSAAVR